MSSRSLGPPSPFAAAVASEIRGWNAKRRISIDDLAAATGMSRNYLYKRLRNELPFNLNDVTAIANALSVDPMDILAEAARQVASDGPASDVG